MKIMGDEAASSVATLLKSRGFKSIAKMISPSMSASDQAAANQAAQQQANSATSQQTDDSSTTEVSVQSTPTSPTGDTSTASKTYSISTVKIASVFAINGTVLGDDGSVLRIDNNLIESALSFYGGNLLDTGYTTERLSVNPNVFTFNNNGLINGSSTANIGNFSMSASASGQPNGVPVLGFIGRVTSSLGQLSQNAIATFAGNGTLFLPDFSLQQDDISKPVFFFVPSAVAAGLLTITQPGTASGVNYNVVDTAAFSQVANDKLTAPYAYNAGTTLFSITGYNSQVLLRPVYLTPENGQALRSAAANGTTSSFYSNFVKQAIRILANSRRSS